MSPFRLITLFALVACSDGSSEPDTGETDVTDEDSGSHPLVPEEFEFVWNTSGECSNEFGDGDQMYVVGEGRLEADGRLTVTEQVYWFYADTERSADCVDTFEITATEELVGDPASLGYTGGEHFYDARRTLTEDGCGENYDRIYRKDDDGLYQRLMFDTLNEFNDSPNEDNKIAVFHEEKSWRGDNYTTKEYAQNPGSKITPDSDFHGPPADIRWIGQRCNITWGGGGGGGGS